MKRDESRDIGVVLDRDLDDEAPGLFVGEGDWWTSMGEGERAATVHYVPASDLEATQKRIAELELARDELARLVRRREIDELESRVKELTDPPP
jgi:hypothetical protein